jgi:hypothetical protein
MKSDIENIDPDLLNDIPKAPFFDDFSTMFGAEVEQGQSFQNQPEYMSFE